MRQVVRLKDRIPVNENGQPVTFYGDNSNDPIIVCTFTDEKEVNWALRLLGYRYSYTLTITE